MEKARAGFSRASLTGIAARIAAGVVIIILGLLVLREAGLLQSGAGSSTTTGSLLAPAAASVQQGPSDAVLAPGEAAPDFEFSDFEGKRLTLSNLRGHALVLNFWATWCLPCRQEMPALQDALGRYSDQGLLVIAVNNGESYQTAANWLKQRAIRLSYIAFDPDEAISRLYGVYGLPTSYFIDAAGRITRVQTGPLTPGIAQSGIEGALAGYAMP